MTRPLRLACALLSPACLAAAAAQQGRLPVAAALLLPGLAWLLAGWRNRAWVSNAGLGIAVLGAGAGLLAGYPAPFLFAGAVLGLLSWDLSDFERRLAGLRSNKPASGQDQLQVQELRSLERRHLAWVGAPLALGLLAAAAARLLPLRLSFPVAWLLALLAVLALTTLILRQMRN